MRNGFGFLGDVSKIKPLTEGYEEKELIDMDHRSLTSAQERMLESVSVPTLSDDTYIPVNGDNEECCGVCGNNECECLNRECEDDVTTTDNIGSAGNPVEGEEPEPQLGGMGGMNFKKEFARTESEDGGMVIDEAPQKNATASYEENSIDKVKDFFDEFQIKLFKDVEKNYDLDASECKVEVSKEPIRRIPKGW